MFSNAEVGGVTMVAAQWNQSEPNQQQEHNATSVSQIEPKIDLHYAQFRDQSRFWIQRVAVPLILVVGLFGNLVTIIIMTRRRMRSTTNMYLAALAFVDIMYLVLTFILGLSHYPNMAEPKYYFYWHFKPFLMMLTDACSNTSVWLTVTFTLERCFAVKYPMKGKIWCTERKAKLMIICVFFMGIIFASPVPFEWQVKSKPVRQATNTPAISGSPMNETEPHPSLKQSNPTTTVSTTTILSTTLPPEEKTTIRYNGISNDSNNSNQVVREQLFLDYTEFGQNETYKNVYYKTTAILFSVVPLLLLVVANGFLIKSVHESRRERQRMTNASGGSIKSSSTTNNSIIKRANIKILCKQESTIGNKQAKNCAVSTGSVRATTSSSNHQHRDRASTYTSAGQIKGLSGVVIGDSANCTGGQSDGQIDKFVPKTSATTAESQEVLENENCDINLNIDNDKKEIKYGNSTTTVKNVQINQDQTQHQESKNNNNNKQLQQNSIKGDQEANLIRISANFQQQHQIASVLKRGPSILKNSSSSSDHHHNHASSQERRITIMLIAVVILFLVCQTPTAILLFYESNREVPVNSDEQALILGLGNIFNCLMAFNAAGNFILYSFLSKKYRKTFVLLFCNCFKRGDPLSKKLNTTEVNHSLTSTAV